MKVQERIVAVAQSAGVFLLGSVLALAGPSRSNEPKKTAPSVEQQITKARCGHLLTNIGVWSPDGQWIVYDTRSTASGDQFDGQRIEMVNVRNGQVRVLYHAQNGAHCGVPTFHPTDAKVVFILGPEHPTADWQYCAWHRQGIIVGLNGDERTQDLDACDLAPPFTPGALRGGSHVHVWDPMGQWVSFTYEDHVLSGFAKETNQQQVNLRNVGVSAPLQPVHVSKLHPRNHDGDYFTVLATKTVGEPRPGSDEINKACEEGWIGTNGYVRADGTRQKHALAFQGQVVTGRHELISEVFVADLPEDLRAPGEGPLAGTETLRPCPPRGTTQRRLTYTADRVFPGLQGPRHWLRSSPDGSQIAFLMKDDAGIVQLWKVSPCGGTAVQLTRNERPIASAFSWSPDGRFIAHVMDNCVCVTETATGQTTTVTERVPDATAPRPEACVFSPDGRQIAFVRTIQMNESYFNQVFVVSIEGRMRSP